MDKILVLNTGGTFNKIYNEITGTLDVSKNNKIIKELIDISFRDNINFEIKGLLYKDSLDITNNDRKKILEIIESYNKIIIVHGTDTMDKTAKFLASKLKDKTVILTGAMKPFSINPIEASSNFSAAVSFISNKPKNGVYISMHGLTKKYTKIKKNRDLGIFQCQK